MRKNHLFQSCELMSDLSADLLFPGEEAFCCVCIKHNCEKKTDKDFLTVQGVAWPAGTRISRMNADGKWEEM